VKNDPLRKLRVLVVDDHPDTTEVISILFRMLGHETRAVLRGRHALTATREFDPDLVVLDLGLPDISGYEVARALKKDGRPRYLAATTGWGREHDRVRAREAGFDHHLTKPIDLSKVRQLLRLADSQRA
jgi:CheY-like chemotaxis protein